MAIIKQFDKRTGIAYVYDSKSYYDKEKKCSRAKRTLIGKLERHIRHLEQVIRTSQKIRDQSSIFTK